MMPTGQMRVAAVVVVNRGACGIVLVLALLLSAVMAPLVGAQTPATGAPFAPVTVSSESAILVDLTSEQVLLGQDIHQQRAVASLTKVMTAVVALQHGKLTDEIVISEQDLPGEASIGLVVGDRMTLETLLYGMLMRSGNDAAAAIARSVGERVAAERGLHTSGAAVFLELMNETAASLGMTNTQFVNPHGLDEAGQYSSAYDLALLTRHALKNETFIKMFAAHSHTYAAGTWSNTNRMIYQYDGLIGGKTGVTDDAGLCLIEVAERGNQRLLTVVLNAPQWYADAGILLDYGFGAGRSAPTSDLTRFGAPSPATGPAPLPAIITTQVPVVRSAAALLTPSAPPAPRQAVTPVAAMATRPAYGSADEAGQQSTVAVSQPAGDDGVNALLQMGIGVVALLLVLAVVVFWLRSAGLGPFVRSSQHDPEQSDAPAPWREYDVAPRRRHASQEDSDDTNEPVLDVEEEQEFDNVALEETIERTGELDTGAVARSEQRSITPSPRAAAENSHLDEVSEAHVIVAVRYVNEGRLEAAESAFMKAIQVAPEFRFSKVPLFWTMAPEGFLALAEAYVRSSRPTDARAVVTLGLITHREHPGLQAMAERLQRERRRSAGLSPQG